MIKSKKEKRENQGIEIDLTSPDGNAFVLLGYAKKWAKQLEYTEKEGKELRLKMMAGDYENLVRVFDEEFGEFVTLYR